MPHAADAGLSSLPQDNPFREAQWTTPHGLPPFERIRPEHYMPAFEASLAAHAAEIEAIAADTAAATFDNTVGAMERAGQALERVAGVF
ncbi:MAG: peptidase M3, partial [Parafilimonas terrae]|nr:peptidase M3 [Parafilimonas terrae]